MISEKNKKISKENLIAIKQSVIFTFIFSVFLFIVYAAQQAGPWWYEFSAHPRDFSNLLGMLFSWSLHSDMSHLIANLSGLAILLPLTLSFYPKQTLKALIVILLTSYLCIWLIGAPNSQHIGASGIVYGLISFSLAMGFYERKIPTIFVSVVVFFFFGATVWGLLPQDGVSFSAHAGGALGGFIAARMLAKRIVKDVKKTPAY